MTKILVGSNGKVISFIGYAHDINSYGTLIISDSVGEIARFTAPYFVINIGNIKGAIGAVPDFFIESK
jgi:hypothetical protein